MLTGCRRHLGRHSGIQSIVQGQRRLGFGTAANINSARLRKAAAPNLGTVIGSWTLRCMNGPPCAHNFTIFLNPAPSTLFSARVIRGFSSAPAANRDGNVSDKIGGTAMDSGNEQPVSAGGNDRADTSDAKTAGGDGGGGGLKDMDRTLVRHVAILTGSQLMLNLGFSQMVRIHFRSAHSSHQHGLRRQQFANHTCMLKMYMHTHEHTCIQRHTLFLTRFQPRYIHYSAMIEL